MRRSTSAFSHSGAHEEYQRSLWRHSVGGFRTTVVSIIENGAGSVEVSARPALPKTRSTSGKDFRIRSWVCKQAARFRDRDARKRRRHVEDRAFVQGRHELVAELEVDRNRRSDDEDRGAIVVFGCRSTKPARRLVDGEESAADRVLLLRVVAADRDLVEDPGEPARPEVNEVHPREEHAQRGIEGEGEQGGDEHGEVLGPGERREEPALLVDEGEDRQEGDGDHQQREEDRRPDFEQRLEPHRVEVALASALLPLLELLVGVLDLHDGAVDEDADRDGDARERHDVRGDAHEATWV